MRVQSLRFLLALVGVTYAIKATNLRSEEQGEGEEELIAAGSL